ncbi:MAG TPA: transcriptional regulator NrdR [bacterium]|nr:transcriptional regulator NrdR [bacterium]
MKCPFCGHQEDKVMDSRPSKGGSAIRRRRECLKCEKRFTTYEQIEEILPMVVKRDGRREPFDRLKIVAGVRKAVEKRPVSSEKIESLVDDIENVLMERSAKEINSTEIGEMVMNRLKDLDDVAYVRFASVYRQFKDINAFMDEVKKMLSRKG